MTIVRLLFLFQLILCCFAYVVSSIDTLKHGDSLNFSSQLVSPKKNFTLGFLTFPDDSNNSYLCIWYTSGSNGHPVWMANRDKPIRNDSAVFALDSTGKLIVSDSRGKIVQLFDGPPGTNLSASLLDSGNFVVRDVKSDGSIGKELWQSFDYPTDTLIPGMKLGVNYRTGKNWSLTSWFGQNSPAPGAFALEWDTVNHRLVVRRRGVIYWTSGTLNNKSFENIVPDVFNLNYDFNYVSNEEEDYFIYSLIVDPLLTPVDRRTISNWILNYQGIIYDRNGPSIAQVDLCYGYRGNDDYRGCELWKQPSCRNMHQKFDLRSGGFVPSNQGIIHYPSTSFSDCRENCWNDCDCVGFKNYGDAECSNWKGNDLRFNQDLSGAAVKYYLLVSDDSNSNESRKKRITSIVTATVVPFVVLLLGLLFYLGRKFKKSGESEISKEKDLLELMSLRENVDEKEFGSDGNNGPGLQVFTYASIMTATDCFSSENKLGQGGFGPVYKGKLHEGREVAIKRLSAQSGQGISEFKNELKLIVKLQHTNLVRLFGCCIHGNEKLLIYEYMPNKSLDFFLFDPTKKSILTWEKRLSIIEGIAQGLLYLHKYSRLKIIHRDLKVSNILLDENMNPKISDFGMARIFMQNVSEANTNRIVGTYGYMAPEYAMEGIFSIKSDVFSFGVMLLELVSGRRNNSFYDHHSSLNLAEHAWELWNKGVAMEFVDPVLGNNSSVVNRFLRCLHIALLCVQERSIDRPVMDEVVSMLTTESLALPIPKKPGFVYRTSRVIVEDVEETNSKNVSVNRLSISDMGAR